MVLLGLFPEKSFAQMNKASSGGILVSPAELAEIKNKALDRIAPYHQNLKQFLHFVDRLVHAASQWQ